MADETSTGSSGKLMVCARIGLRALALLFGIVVMGVIADKLKESPRACIFGLKIGENKGDVNACNYGIAMGALTLLFVIVYITLDVLLYFCEVGSAVVKKFYTISDLVLSGLLAFLWIVGFIYLLDKWVEAEPKDKEYYGYKINDLAAEAGAAIAFSLMSGVVWIVLAIMAGIRLKKALA